MAATELQSRADAATATKATELNEKVSRQVYQILEESVQRDKVHQPVLTYRIPSPGVRYYF